MKINLYLSTAVAGMMIGGNVWAQCVTTQDCASLGYTESSCPDGNGVKCPFGDKWFCASTEITPEQCTELGFTLSCTGTGETAAGKTCNGKYNYCACKDGYMWQNGTCKQSTPDYSNCFIGALFYSDNTCSDKLESSKTLLGVVIYEKRASQNGWIMTVKPIETGIYWSTEYKDIPGLTNITSESGLTDVQASCSNTDVITAYGNSSKYPAAWAAKNYKPSGTPSGKTWCLPSGGLLKDSLDNSTNLTRINAGITTAGGKKIGFGTSSSYDYVWSSSEYAYNFAWFFYANTGGSFRMGDATKRYTNDYSVRPVLAF